MSIDVNKITENILKELEAVAPPGQEEPEAPLSTQQKAVRTAATKGGTLSAEKYAGMLKDLLMSPQITAQNRLAAMEQAFGEKNKSLAQALNRVLVKAGAGAKKGA